ncbi:RNase A-like domain-containing protein [Enterobacteriaceae bacterium LUAb1]
MEYTYNQAVGHYIKNGSTELVRTSKIKVVPEHTSYNDKPYYILTAFPTW